MMPMVLDDDLIYPETPYLFSVKTPAGYAEIAVDETQWDIAATFKVRAFGSPAAHLFLNLHFDRYGIDLQGKAIDLDDPRLSPEAIFNTLSRQDQDKGYVASFELLYGTQPEALPDTFIIPETGDNAEDSPPAKPIFEAADFEPWVGFDLDGTLAVRVSDDETAMGVVGDPIWPIVQLLHEHLEDGDTVKIFTARAADERQIPHVKAWLDDLDLGNLEITNIKDPGMIKLYDDRVSKVVTDQGIVLESAVSFKQKKFTLADRYQFQGMPISIENKAGSVRRGVDPDGHEWTTKMHFDYGYIRRTEGEDGEGIDVYVGKDRKAQHVYIVKQHKIEAVKAWGGEYCPDCSEHVHDCGCKKYYDEDKVFIGFPSKKAAVEAYMKQYDSPLFLGPVSTMTVESFRELVTGRKLRVEIPLQLVAESATPWELSSGVVGVLSKKTVGEISKMGFSTTAGPVTVTSAAARHINDRHGRQLTEADKKWLKKAIERPTDILPNIGKGAQAYRGQSVLLVSQRMDDHVAIVEITTGDNDNILWNFWKFSSRKKAEKYLKKFRNKKAQIIAESGGRQSPYSSQHGLAKVGKPESLSGSQTQQLGLFENSTDNDGVKAFFESADDWRSRIQKAKYLCDVKDSVREVLDLQDILPTSEPMIKALSRFFSRLDMQKHQYDLAMLHKDGQKVVETVTGWRHGDIFATHQSKESWVWVVTHLQTGGKVRAYKTKIQAAEFMWRATQLGKDIWDFDTFEQMPKELNGQMMSIIKSMSAGMIPFELMDRLRIGD